MSRRDEAQAARDRGLSTRQVADELGISQTRVCQLLNTTQANTVQLAGAAGPVNTTQDPAALREQVIAELRTQIREQERGLVRAASESRWNALSAERDALAAQVREPAATGPCPGCARLERDYEALEAGRDDLARRLSALEDPC